MELNTKCRYFDNT